MYTFIKLTVPPAVMGLFDASNRDQCEVRRLKTNTPLQALAMMNDPMVLEASRVLAQKLATEHSSDKEKILKAFRLIVCRKPSEKEMTIMEDYYASQLEAYRARKLDAARTLNIGEYPQDKHADSNTSAALAKLIGTLYNLEEAITKS